MPRDQPVRWESSELISVLNYINNNIDLWYSSHINACIKAIEATGSRRDAKSIYNKVHSLVSTMEDFIKTGKKSSTNAIIWDDSTIHDLVRYIYSKTQEKKKEEKNQSNKNRASDGDGDIEMSDRYVDYNKMENVKSIVLNFDESSKIYIYYEFFIDIYDLLSFSTDQVTTESSSQMVVNGNGSQVPFSTDAVIDLYDEKIQQIDQLRSELSETVKNANSAFAKLNAQQVPYSIEVVNITCEGKVKEISKLRDELIKMIEDANNKYEKLKNFQ